MPASAALWVAPVSTRELTKYPSWPTVTAAKAHMAIREADPSPLPRIPQTGRKRSPVARSEGMSTRAWAAMPSVALPPRTAIIVGLHSDTGACSGVPVTRNHVSPAMATTLARAGAHMKAANRLCAVSTCPRSV